MNLIVQNTWNLKFEFFAESHSPVGDGSHCIPVCTMPFHDENRM